MFYDRYIELCRKIGEKPYTVAKKLELTNSNVAQWKKGSTPRPAVLQKIADYFGVKVSYFFEAGEVKKESPPAQGGEPPKYNQLTPENRAMIDDLIEKLLKSQSGG